MTKEEDLTAISAVLICAYPSTILSLLEWAVLL